MKTIKLSNLTIAPEHKTSNKYSITKDVYNHLLDNAVTAAYKKPAEEIDDGINEEDKVRKMSWYT